MGIFRRECLRCCGLVDLSLPDFSGYEDLGAADQHFTIFWGHRHGDEVEVLLKAPTNRRGPVAPDLSRRLKDEYDLLKKLEGPEFPQAIDLYRYDRHPVPLDR